MKTIYFLLKICFFIMIVSNQLLAQGYSKKHGVLFDKTKILLGTSWYKDWASCLANPESLYPVKSIFIGRIKDSTDIYKVWSMLTADTAWISRFYSAGEGKSRLITNQDQHEEIHSVSINEVMPIKIYFECLKDGTKRKKAWKQSIKNKLELGQQVVEVVFNHDGRLIYDIYIINRKTVVYFNVMPIVVNDTLHHITKKAYVTFPDK